MRPQALTISYFDKSMDSRYMDSQQAKYDAANYVLNHPEIYKKSPYENYFIAKNGDIFRLRRHKIYKLSLSEKSLNNAGYRLVSLYIGQRQKTFTHHSLVAATWLGERPKGYDINHINENKLDNSVENLEYVTKSDNMKKYYAKFGERKPGYTGRNNRTRKETIV